MSEKTITPPRPASGWRFKAGIALFLCSIILPIAGLPLATMINLSAVKLTALSGVLLVGAELLGIIAVAVMGKSGFTYIKHRIFGFLKQLAPPSKVSRLRYSIGLVMFSAPILFAWVSIYIADLIPGFTTAPLAYAVAGDLLLLMSLFVLGGDFWDKIRSLFIYDAKAVFSK